MAMSPDDPSFLERLKGVLAAPGMGNLGAALLANSGYSNVPRSFGQIAGTSYLQSQQMAAEQQNQDIRRRYMEAQIQALGNKQAESPFGAVQPDKFTPESLRKFMQTGDYGTLIPTAGGSNIGNFNPGDYTPESFAKFAASGYKDPALLRRYVTPANPSVQIVNGVPTVVQPSRPGAAGPSVPTQSPLSTLESEADAARRKAQAEATGKATGTATGEAAGGIIKKGATAGTIGQILDLADPLIDAATGSLVGAGRDKVVGWLGYAPDSAQAAAQLRVLEGALMLNQPRMEGPQSNLDQILYRQMAAEIGNATVPAAQKKAALKTIRRLQEKYKDAAKETMQIYGEGEAPDSDPLGILK